MLNVTNVSQRCQSIADTTSSTRGAVFWSSARPTGAVFVLIALSTCHLPKFLSLSLILPLACSPSLFRVSNSRLSLHFLVFFLLFIKFVRLEMFFCARFVTTSCNVLIETKCCPCVMLKNKQQVGLKATTTTTTTTTLAIITASKYSWGC